MPHDADSVETAIKYAKMALAETQQNGSGTIHPDVGECSNDERRGLQHIIVELDFNFSPFEIEKRYETFARINVPGIILRGSQPDTVICGGGVRVTGQTAVNVVLQNLTISDPARHGTWNKNEAHGLLVDNGASVKIANCNFVNCGGSGVCVRDKGSVALLADVIASHNARSGVYVVNGGNATISGSRSAAHNNQGFGLEARGEGSSILVESAECAVVTSRIDRSSRFATRTVVVSETAIAFANKDQNVFQSTGGKIVFSQPP